MLPLRRNLPRVPFLAVLREIEALNFLLLGNAKSDDKVHDLQDYERAHDGQDPGDDDTDKLIAPLVVVAFQKSGGKRDALRVFEDGIYRGNSEDAGEQRAQGSTGAMHAEGIQTVVVTEASLYLRDHPETESSG